LQAYCFPILEKTEVVSQPVKSDMKASYTNYELGYISYHLYHQIQSPCITTALLCAASVESRAEHTKYQNICNTSPKWKVNLCLLTDTVHSAKDKHFRSFPIGTEVLSFADSRAESSSFQHMKKRKEA
jgi:hypothetical protein